MNIYIIIPAHNEEQFIGQTLQSLVDQTVRPKKIVVVDDHSTDKTKQIVQKFTAIYDFITLKHATSSEKHLPGSKVIQAFHQGLAIVDEDYDVICKFDADLIFPKNYLKNIVSAFQKNPKTGMAGGFCYIKNSKDWVLESLTNKDHIRGALKAYRKECFKDIGGLKPAMGWDTIDEMLAQYHGWSVVTDETLRVKHLKPTGHIYNSDAKYKQGEAFYRIRYGFIITLIASIKLAFLKKQPKLIRDFLAGFFKAKREGQSFLVSKPEGEFIRKLRWRNIRKKLL